MAIAGEGGLTRSAWSTRTDAEEEGGEEGEGAESEEESGIKKYDAPWRVFISVASPNPCGAHGPPQLESSSIFRPRRVFLVSFRRSISENRRHRVRESGGRIFRPEDQTLARRKVTKMQPKKTSKVS